MNNVSLKYFIFETMIIRENYNLKSLNTFGINVDAKCFTEVASLEDIIEVSDYIPEKKLPLLVLGGGSNILFTKDFDGLIIKINLQGIELISEDAEFYYVKVQAGENWDEFVKYCVDMNYAGAENLSLIPGNVGASPIQNIGAYGSEMKDIFEELEMFDFGEGIIRKMRTEDCRFEYRNSIFKNELKGKVIILSVTFRLNKFPLFKTEYGAIKDELTKMGVERPSIQTIRNAVINIRRSKLPDPDEIGNAGSFFKNPTVSNKFHEELKSRFPKLVSFPQPGGTYKLAAGWLIEQCGWKGKRVGDAGVHEKQALVIVNYGNANGKEILELTGEIKKSVLEHFGVDLETEVNII
jgi:UDP-N-acetylmuramate dehydrogenase